MKTPRKMHSEILRTRDEEDLEGASARRARMQSGERKIYSIMTRRGSVAQKSTNEEIENDPYEDTAMNEEYEETTVHKGRLPRGV